MTPFTNTYTSAFERSERMREAYGAEINRQRMEFYRALYAAHQTGREHDGNGPEGFVVATCSCGWRGTSAGNYRQDRDRLVDGEISRHMHFHVDGKPFTPDLEKALAAAEESVREDKDCAMLDEIAVGDRIPQEVF